MKILALLLLLVGWGGAAGLSTADIRYEVAYGTDPLTLDKVMVTDSLEVTLTDLEAGATYYAAVTAISPEGVRSQPSALVTYTVPAADVRVTLQESGDLGEWLDVVTVYRPRAARKFYRIKIEK